MHKCSYYNQFVYGIPERESSYYKYKNPEDEDIIQYFKWAKIPLTDTLIDIYKNDKAVEDAFFEIRWNESSKLFLNRWENIFNSLEASWGTQAINYIIAISQAIREFFPKLNNNQATALMVMYFLSIGLIG